MKMKTKMRKIDIIVSLIIGAVVALFSLGILKNIGVEEIFGIDMKLIAMVIPILFPILSAVCLYIACIIGRKFLVVFQIAKFVLTGALNTFIDLGILNLLINISETSVGPIVSGFKGISFLLASLNSYFLNKFWTFGIPNDKKTHKEFFQFFMVSIIGFIINVGAFSFINCIEPQFGFSHKIWANVAALTATFAGMAWNFAGYKFIVFKK